MMLLLEEYLFYQMVGSERQKSAYYIQDGDENQSKKRIVHRVLPHIYY